MIFYPLFFLGTTFTMFNNTGRHFLTQNNQSLETFKQYDAIFSIAATLYSLLNLYSLWWLHSHVRRAPSAFCLLI